MKIFTKFIILMIIGGVFFTACRRHHPPSFQKFTEFITKKLTKELDLNESQKTVLEKLKNEVIAKRQELQVRGHGERIPKELVEEIRKEKIDEAKTLKYFEAESAKHIALRGFILKKFIEFHSVLNPEQRNKLGDLILKMQKRFQHND